MIRTARRIAHRIAHRIALGIGAGSLGTAGIWLVGAVLVAGCGACTRKPATPARGDSVPVVVRPSERRDAGVPTSCRGLTEPACRAHTNCQAVTGSSPEGATVYAGCFTAIVNGDPLLCAEAFTCAKGPPPGGRCLRFSSSCIPDDWTPVPQCDEAGCPSPSPSPSN